MRHSHSLLAFGALVAGAVAFSGPATAATGADYYNGKRLLTRRHVNGVPGAATVARNDADGVEWNPKDDRTWGDRRKHGGYGEP